MKILTRLFFSALCIGVLLFCGFGFMATFEPLDRHVQITWRAVYGIVGLLAVIGIVLLNRPRKRIDQPE